MELGEFIKTIEGGDIDSLEKTFGPLYREEEVSTELVNALSSTRDELENWSRSNHAHEEGLSKLRDYQLVVQALQQAG